MLAVAIIIVVCLLVALGLLLALTWHLAYERGRQDKERAMRALSRVQDVDKYGRISFHKPYDWWKSEGPKDSI